MSDEFEERDPAALIVAAPAPAPDPTNIDTIPHSIFTPRQKAFIVALVSIAATFSGISGNIYFPAIPLIASSLSVSSELINLTVTSYMIMQGLSSTIWGALADVE